MYPIIFAHGMEGSPNGNKATMLKTRFEARCPDLRSLDLTQQISLLAEELEAPSILVGSSLGGLAALGACRERPDLVTHLVLLAPAVGMDRLAADHPEVEQRRPGLFIQAREVGSSCIPEKAPATIIHGLHDELIRTRDVVALAKRSPSARLLLVQDNHSLSASFEIIAGAIEAAARKSSPLFAGLVI